MRKYHSFDITKFVMSLAVVAIHVNPLGGGTDHIRYPLLVTAVPIFFIISSFLFFKKFQEDSEKKLILKKFVFRNLRLYFMWFIALLPFTIYIREYFAEGIWKGLQKMGICFLLESTFVASWFIMALIIGTILIVVLSERLGNNGALFISALLYAVCICASTYRNFFDNCSWIIKLTQIYPYDLYICNSFPVAMLWIAIGKICAENENKLINLKKNRQIALAVILLAFTYGEYWIIEKSVGIGQYTSSIMLPFCCTTLFIVILQWNINDIGIDFSFFRRMSTIIYCSHVPISCILRYIMKKFFLSTENLPVSIVWYFITVIICILFAIVIDCLKRCPKLEWLGWFQ